MLFEIGVENEHPGFFFKQGYLYNSESTSERGESIGAVSGGLSRRG